MSKFVDREVQYPNRKKLTIKDITYDENGEIYELIVDEARNEGTIYENGTPLKASNLNATVKEMIESAVKIALENYHENGMAVLENAEATVLFDGSCAMYDSIYIDVSEAVRIVIENDYQEYFTVSAPNSVSAGTITIDITACQDPESSGATEFDFVVKLYSQETDELIKKVTCTVTFQVPSTTPED
ncbi:MAG: hypothetical protein J6K18_00085 [Bacilli bacterium]|nr:hypothetical protein [Bacilli bacterium]